MSERIFDRYWAGIDAAKVTERKDPTFGPVTVFHDVVLAREIVQPYNIDGKTLMAYKSADELERYWRWIEGRWAVAGKHPSTPVIVSPDDIAGRTVNIRFVKNLIDHAKTERPNIRGILGDLEVFNDRVAPEILNGMKDGSLPDVSIGFLYAKEATSGNWNGSDYDFRQVDMFHDHTAFGIKKGRCTWPYCGVGADSLFTIEKSLNGESGKIDMNHMAIVGRDPEETENTIQIPGPGGDCEVTATIQISEDQGIQATYCGGTSEVRTYIFSKEKGWTMEKAQTWVDEHKEDTEAAGDVLIAGGRIYRLIGLDPEEGPRTEEERAKAHFNISDEEWDKLTDEEKQAYIDKLPPRGSAQEQETEGARTDPERAMAHYGVSSEEVWESLSDSARSALIAALPDRGAGGDEMTEEELKAKIAEIQKQIDDLYSESPESAEAEGLYAELEGYTKALAALIAAKVLPETGEGKIGEDEVARSKRLLKDPRLKRDPIRRT